ncbi:unnamed protein product [Coregonus sp. 'balchen']|nr:unnamed protein product [Coregonus sp. 'balchen']
MVGMLEPNYWRPVYEDLDCFKLNDTLEVYGIISVNPVLSLLGVCECVRIAHIIVYPHRDPTERMATPEEQRAHDPPASLVPRLHMLCPLQHNNPLLPSTPTEDQSAFVSSFLVEMASVKAELLAYLTHVLLGDGLAADMNSLHLVPKKDYVANRLVSGALQLARNTSLFLDETQLEQGVRNITALGNLISWQKVDYDFNYHQMEFPCNINVLVTSEGRSLLPSDCQVPLQPQVTPPNMEEYLTTIHMAQLTSQLNKFRVYLSVPQTLDYSISDEAVEDYFVDMRKYDPQCVTAEDLHRIVVVARVVRWAGPPCGRSEGPLPPLSASGKAEILIETGHFWLWALLHLCHGKVDALGKSGLGQAGHLHHGALDLGKGRDHSGAIAVGGQGAQAALHVRAARSCRAELLGSQEIGSGGNI